MTQKSQHKNPDSIIFDMDGTLWDAVATYTLAWNKYFKKKGEDTVFRKRDLDALMGLEEAQFLEKMLPEMSLKKRKESYFEVIQLQYDLIDEIGGLIYPKVKEYLEKLSAKYKLFIVSNCPKYTIKHFMKFAKIEHLITDDRSHGQNYKAKHENITSLVRENKLKNPVYVGDTNGDMEQSRKANIPFIFMTYGFGTCETYDKSFNSFEAFALYYLNA